MGGACGTYVMKKNAYSVLVGKLEGRGSLGRSKSRGENNVDWIYLAQDRQKGRSVAVMKFRVI